MGTNRVEKIETILEHLGKTTTDITGSALVNSDGFVIASLLDRKVDEDLVAAMATTIFSVGERISSQLMNSVLEQTYVRTPNGYVVIHAVSKEMMLVCLTTKEAKLGLIFLEVKGHAKQLAELL